MQTCKMPLFWANNQQMWTLWMEQKRHLDGKEEIMAVKLEFYISDNDMDRLFALKEDAGKDNLSGNEY